MKEKYLIYFPFLRLHCVLFSEFLFCTISQMLFNYEKTNKRSRAHSQCAESFLSKCWRNSNTYSLGISLFLFWMNWSISKQTFLYALRVCVCAYHNVCKYGIKLRINDDASPISLTLIGCVNLRKIYQKMWSVCHRA